MSPYAHYAGLLQSTLAPLRPFQAESESPGTLQIERGVLWPQLLLNPREPAHPGPLDGLIELAETAPPTIIDRNGHRRGVYAPLLLYAALQTYKLAYERLPQTVFGAWERALTALAQQQADALLKIDLQATADTPLPAARGDAVATAALSALALYLAGKLFIRDAWLDLASQTFGRLHRSQQKSGEFLLATAADNPEPLAYHELVILHAAASYAVQAEDRPLSTAIARATQFHQEQTQPDHATAQPWGLFAFIWNEPTRPFADQLLHAATTLPASTGASAPSGLTSILLADALYCLRLFPT